MTLKQSAHNQLNQCCQTLCNKKAVLEYIGELESKIELFESEKEERNRLIDEISDVLKDRLC